MFKITQNQEISSTYREGNKPNYLYILIKFKLVKIKKTL